MEADAQGYDELSKPQVESARKFISELKLSQGAKVLDMGCGTGIVTKYIADTVGADGQVVGVDPDAARIKIAKENYEDIHHLQFHVGNSLTGFPHDSEEYYDIQISTQAFHWFPDDQKKLYVRKAHQSLKRGGTLAILCGDKVADNDGGTYQAMGLHPMSHDEYQQLFQDIGLFPNVAIKKVIDTARFETYEIFKRWAKASSHKDLDEITPAFLKPLLEKFVTFHDDGSVTALQPLLHILARKD